jgi:hypothetical protein
MRRLAGFLIRGSVLLLFVLLAALQIEAFFGTGDPFLLQFRGRAGQFVSFSEHLGVVFRNRKQARPVIRVGPVESSFPMAWTERELEAKRSLERLMEQREPTHRLIYDSVKTLTGTLLEDHPGYIVFSQQYGDSGQMSIQLARSRIVRIEECSPGRTEISRRDVRFHMQFPQKNFYKSPPYTIISEESFFAVEDIVKQLQTLYVQITETFKPLITSGARKADIQLLVLSNADEYATYRTRYAFDLEGSSGFYSHSMDQMVVYHQRGSSWVQDGKGRIASLERQYQDTLRTEQARRELVRWKNTEQRKLLAEAHRATHSTIRHEGAHQLLFTLGIQNAAQSGRAWVTEGLAVYCETERVGQLNLRRRDELKEAWAAGRVIPLRRLMSERRFKTSLEYAEAWALMHLLMHPEYRNGFFDYLDWLRMNPGPAKNSVEELTRFLPVTFPELEEKWMACLRRLSS